MSSKAIKSASRPDPTGSGEELPSLEGAYLVLAGPGTGKTTLLCERVRQIFAAPHSTKGKVLALTFTNKAAGEMKARLLSLISNLESRAFIGTFHSFANSILRAHGHMLDISADFVIYDERDQNALLQQLQEEGRIATGLNLESVVTAFSKLKSRGLLGSNSEEATSDLSASLRSIHKTYHDAMRSANALDFGDLILYCNHLLREHPQVLRLYRVAYGHVLVDEFQDTTPAQYELLRLLVDTVKPNIFSVADEDQLIFEWNEARLETLNHFCGDFQAKVIYSTLSHRCPPNIVEAANSVISKNRFRFPGKPEIRARPKNVQAIQLYKASSEEDEASFVAGTINQLSSDGYSLGSIAVIGRARRLLDPIETALREANIPAARPSLAGLGGSQEADLILRLLKWLQNNRDEQSARYVIGFLRPHLSGAFEVAVRESRQMAVGVEAALAGQEDHDLRHVLELVAKWRLSIRDTQRLFGQLRTDLPTLLEDGIEGSTAEEFLKILEQLDTLRQRISPRERLSLPDFLLGLPQMVGSLSQAEVSRRSGVISLLTYHQAKGLEFEVVFLVGVEDGVFPDFRSEKDLRRLEEERRLFYVGITRTKSRLYLTFAQQRRTVGGTIRPRGPSRFLSEIPKDLITPVE